MTRSHEEEHHEAGPLGLSGAIAKGIAERLVAARIQKGLTVQDLSQRVRIREHFTQAIESGDWSTLPTGLNGRGLIRLYARELGVRVPELDPTVHLTEGNARVELAQQAHTNDAIREHTIRTMKLGAVANPVARGAPPELMYRSVPRGKTSVRTPPGAPVLRNDAPLPVPLSHRSSGNPSHPAVPPQDTSADDVITPDIEDVLGLKFQADAPPTVRDREPEDAEAAPGHLPWTGWGAEDERLSAPGAPSEVQPANLAGTTGAADADDPEDVPAVDVFGSLGLNAGQAEVTESPSEPVPRHPVLTRQASVSQTDGKTAPLTTSHNSGLGTAPGPEGEQKGSPAEAAVPLSHAAPTTVPLGFIDDRNGAFSSDAVVTQPAGIIRGEQVAQAALGDQGRRRRSNRAGLYSKVGGLVLALAAVVVVAFAVMKQRNTGPDKAVAIRDLSDRTVTKNSSMEKATTDSAAQTTNDVSSQVGSASVAQPEADSSASGLSAETTSGGVPNVGAASSSVQTDAPGDVLPGGPESAKTTSGSSDLAQEPSNEAAVPQNQQPAAVEALGAGSARATLRIAAPVELQVRADGRVVTSGVRAPGEFDVLFNQKAEILAEDGSLVSLKYAGWDHGKLGHDGRRRRLILQASPFTR